MDKRTLKHAPARVEHARHLLDNAALETGFSALLGLFTAYLCWQTLGAPVAVGFAALIVTTSVSRYLLARHFQSRLQGIADEPNWPLALALTMVLTGLLWGSISAGIIFAYGIQPAVLALSLGTVALSVIVIAAYRGLPQITLPFVISALAIPSITLITMGKPAEFALGGTLALVACAMVFLAREFRCQVFELYALETDKNELVDYLNSRNQELSALKVGLKTHMDKREVLEEELRIKDADLNLMSGKARALADTLQRVSPLDNLTGLLNVEHLQDRLEDEWSRTLREDKPITLIHIELDEFESFGETYGGQALESCIKKVTNVIDKAGRRPGDCGGRIDTTKFAVILPGADTKNGLQIANRMRDRIEALNIANADSLSHTVVTGAFGIATIIPNKDMPLQELVDRADSALYEAKFRGGNKVIQYRSMNAVRLEHWDAKAEGQFSGEGLVRKLTIWGYRPDKKVYEPGECVSDRRTTADTVGAIVQGQLRISLDGETQVLHPGDCIFIPKGFTTCAEVVSNVPVICLEGERAA